MGMEQKKKNSSFLIQGMILATAGIITRLIGIAYRIPINNILGDEGQGFYGCAFSIYNIALLLTSYSLPLAVSKLVSARISKKEYKYTMINISKIKSIVSYWNFLFNILIKIINNPEANEHIKKLYCFIILKELLFRKQKNLKGK